MDRNEALIKSITENTLGLDDTFKFHCTQCGKCCINREDILMSSRDLYNAAKELGMTIAQFVEDYCEIYLGSESRLPIIRLKPRGSIKRCPLLKDQKCSIHKAKPTVCALFPIGRGFMQEAEKGKAPKPMSAEHMRYFLNHPGCGDDSETHTLREWLDAFNLPYMDEFFVKWQQMVFTLLPFIHRAEEILPPPAFNIVVNILIERIYIDYNLDEEFEPQYDEHIKWVVGFMNSMPDPGKKGK